MTVSKAACRRVRPSLLIWAMPDAELGDGGLDVGLLLVHAVELLAETGQIVVGLQVDAAEALAVGLDAEELAVGLLEARQRRSRLDLGQPQAVLGCAGELLADLARLLGAALARILEPRLGAGARLALVGDGGLGGAQLLRRLALGVLGGGQPVGGTLTLPLGGGKLAHELLASRVDEGRQLGELGDLAFRLGDALFQRGDLLVGAGAARLPALALDLDGRLPLAARAMLALERDELGPRLAHARAQGGSLGLGGGKLRLEGLGPAQRLQGCSRCR